MDNIDQGIENHSKKFCENFFQVKIMVCRSPVSRKNLVRFGDRNSVRFGSVERF